MASLALVLVVHVLPAVVLGAAVPDNMVDMTHGLKEGIPAFPGHEQYNFTINIRGEYPMLKNPDIYIELNTIYLSEHTATHVDAPAHFGKGKWRIHQIPNKDLIGPGAVIDISEKAAEDPDAEVSVDDVTKYEEKYGQIPNRAFVFANAGWEKKWTDVNAFMGASSFSKENIRSFHWPGFSIAATKWLVEKRDILGIGTDTISFEVGTTKDFPVHRYLLERNKLGFEMVANLSNVPPAGATIYAFPMKIIEGSGAPVRMFATWSNAATGLRPSFYFLTVLAAILLLTKQ